MVLSSVLLGAEFHSLSSGIDFSRSHRAKTSAYFRSTHFICFVLKMLKKYFLSGFIAKPVLSLKMNQFDAEFTSLSNGIIFNGVIEQKLSFYADLIV